ncbi:hypothetical protein D2A34_24725 [Clostridium chromiireducens]|uniref:Uncharacterized protein n=1 Tax=Clostridium chromiireducens TaxID=225345 RepID=A0A399IIC0_9CLOT|nr:hypothetical protein [Clostridium chromiireducens]RII32127.1 hypothetical protein D2A34_24725 [Clostridium chromiireducens]
MDSNTMLMMVYVIGIIFLIFYLETRRDKKMFNLEKEIKELLSITASLKLRVYDHEKYLLDKDGVYIPDEMGEYYFKQTWALIDEETKELITKEYKDVCPESIPLWKYFLYSYKPEIKVQRKIKLRKVESVEELMYVTIKETEDLTKQLKKVNEERNKILDELNSMTNKVKDITKEDE